MKPETFDRLFDQHASPLLAFLTYRLGDRASAEDVLADTFERALRKRRTFDPRRGNEKAWLYAIALNLVRDRGRRAASEERALTRAAPLPSEVAADPLQQVELRQTVGEALRVLTDEEREAVSLRYGADLTLPEIARLLKVPLSTVEGRVYRALRKLREELVP
ncbi:MAG TPA: sigma-70 family RNA polymerase sigma factor [Solirubrobacteraceae bacterium]|nr:sigma-70 family RNA polymerase sigma factor [Solirubrobacteraceae bacterium]